MEGSEKGAWRERRMGDYTRWILFIVVVMCVCTICENVHMDLSMLFAKVAIGTTFVHDFSTRHV